MIVSEKFREVSSSSAEQPLNCDVLPQIYQVMVRVKWVVVIGQNLPLITS